MSAEIGTATNASDLLDKLNTFLTKGHSLTPSYTGVGTGTITGTMGTATSVLETITITLTSSTAFSVSGSVTGSMGTGTVGTLFTHAKATFTVNAGGTAWANGDTIVFVMTPPWVQQRGVTGNEYIWKAPGNDGLATIYVGALRFNDVGAGNYDNWRLGGFTGYDGPSAFTAQPGFIGVPGPVLPLWASSIPYWFVASGRRVVIIAKVSTNYESAYLGFINPYASPGQYPYPLALGGCMAWLSEPISTSSNWRYSYTGVEHRAFPMSNHNQSSNGFGGQLRLRKPDGSWMGFKDTWTSATPGAIWPFNTSTPNGVVFNDLRPNLDGSYPMFPVVMTEDMGSGVTNVFGELDGVRATTGHSNASENTITDGRDTWLVVQNVAATTKKDYFTVRLD